MNTELHDKLKPEYEVDFLSLGIFAALVAIVGLVAVQLINSNPNHHSVAPLAAVVEAVPEPEDDEPVVPKVNPFDSVQVEGFAAVVWDAAQNKILYGKNEETQLPLASITKLMTVAAAAPYIENDETLVVEDRSLYEDGDSGLLANEEWNARDLIDFTLLVSSNDGADVLANAAGAAKLVRGGGNEDNPEAAFVNSMNDIAQSLGLSQTYFINETGLDPTTNVSGGYGSAYDTALLMEYIVREHSDLVSATTKPEMTFTSLSNFEHEAENTNIITNTIPGLIASKTGFTDLAGGNLVVAFDAGINRPIVVAVLGSSKEGRFTDVQTLVDASLEYLSE